MRRLADEPPRKDGKKPRFEPMGPYAPPLPTDVERTEGEPMAVANDKQTLHGESFLPTTQSKDSFDADVARKWAFLPGKQAGRPGRDAVEDGLAAGPRSAGRRPVDPEAEKPETVRMEKDPPGYSDVDGRGWRRLLADDEA